MGPGLPPNTDRRATTHATARGCSSTACCPRQGPPGAGRAEGSAPPWWRQVAAQRLRRARGRGGEAPGGCPASPESAWPRRRSPRWLRSVSGERVAEAEKPQVDELIRPVLALVGSAHGPRLVGFTGRVEAVGGTLRIQSRAGRRTGHLVARPLVAPRG